MNRMTGLAASAVVLAMVVPGEARAQGSPVGFFVLPPTPVAPGWFAPLGISADGQTVVGGGPAPSGLRDDEVAYRWSVTTGYVPIFGAPYESAFANGISADGRVVIGAARRPGDDSAYLRPVRQVGNGAPEPLGEFDSSKFYATARGISGDGSTAIVEVQTTTFYRLQAARWTAARGLEYLEAPGFDNTAPSAITADGKTIIGTASSPGNSRGFLWREGVGFELLPSISSFFRSTDAYGCSADGRFVVGTSLGDDFWGHAVVWDRGIVRDLGRVSVDGSTAARLVSGDGSIIVGESDLGVLPYPTAIIWTESAGLVTLTNYLNIIGIPLPAGTDETSIFSIRGITPDGRTLTGFANPLSPTPIGFVLTIPSPSMVVFSLSFLSLSRRRRLR